MWPSAGQHALYPFVKPPHTERYLKAKLFSGNNIGNPDTSMATSLWAFRPRCPPRELTVDHAAHQAVSTHSRRLLQVMLQVKMKSDFTGEVTVTSNQITILLWEKLPFILWRSSFYIFVGKKYPFLHKLVAIIENDGPHFTKSKLVSPIFFL